MESLLAGLAVKLEVAVKIIVFYMIRMITFAGKFLQAEGTFYSWVSAGLICAMLAGAIMLLRRHPQLLFGLLF